MLDLNEIFGPTIQGEGKRIGKVSIFIRFSKCNFSCSGFGVEYITPKGEKKLGCDTYYAVDKSFKNEWRKSSYEDIIKEVNQRCNKKLYDIVITGGEPLLLWNKKEFQELLKYFILKGHKVTIETNASLNIDFTCNYQKSILFSMSVKLSNANEKYEKRINISTLKNIIQNTKDAYLKFVLNEKNIQELEKEIEEIKNVLPKIDIYLMPMGDNIKDLSLNDKSIIELCIKHDYIYSDRTHIRIWGDKRGV